MGREPARAGSTPAGHPQAHGDLTRRELERQSTGLLTRHVRVRAPGDAHTTPSWRNRQTHRSQKPEPQGMSVRLGPRGPISSPVAQRQSGALIRRRPVDRSHPGPPIQGVLPERQGAGLPSEGRRRRRRGRSIRSLSAIGPCGCSSEAEQPAFNRQVRVRRPAPAPWPNTDGV